eukprot:5069154-Prymnesium_polylepis.1
MASTRLPRPLHAAGTRAPPSGGRRKALPNIAGGPSSTVRVRVEVAPLACCVMGVLVSIARP